MALGLSGALTFAHLPRGRIQKFLWPVLAFGAGAIFGAFIFLQVSLWALALPLIILASLALSPANQA